MISENQYIDLSFPNNITLTIKREDQIHPFVSGNKYRKLKYNLQEAKNNNATTLLTFGGAYSNHILAVAAAAKAAGFESIGVIRGEELASKINENKTLSLAQSFGMQFDFVSREVYRDKENLDFIKSLRLKWGDFYVLPEGGTNILAIKGCSEIIQPSDVAFDYICCSVGTGGTLAGLIKSAFVHQKVIGFSALKTDYLQDEILKFAPLNNWKLDIAYHFGGYAKVNDQLIDFINDFYQKTKIPLDPIYTGKMIFGVLDKIEKGFFKPNTKILAIHTGGLQGISGMNDVLRKKNKQTINITHE